MSVSFCILLPQDSSQKRESNFRGYTRFPLTLTSGIGKQSTPTSTLELCKSFRIISSPLQGSAMRMMGLAVILVGVMVTVIMVMIMIMVIYGYDYG